LAVVGMRVRDTYPNGKRWWLRLHEKGGKFHEVPAHHKIEEYLDPYLEALHTQAAPRTGVRGLAGAQETDRNAPLFRTAAGRTGMLTGNAMTRNDALRMVKRRAVDAGLLPEAVCCHTFRATGITSFLENGGAIETAQAIAAHESPRTTKVYDRTGDKITLEEVERVRI